MSSQPIYIPDARTTKAVLEGSYQPGDEFKRPPEPKEFRQLTPKITDEEFVKRFRSALKIGDDGEIHRNHPGTLEAVARQLPKLVSVDKELFLKAYDYMESKGVGDPVPDDYETVRELAGKALGPLAVVDYAEYKKRYDGEGRGINHSKSEIRDSVSESIKYLAGTSEFEKLFTQGMSSEDRYVNVGTADSLGYLARHNPTQYVKLFKKYIDDESLRNRDPEPGPAILARLARGMGELARSSPNDYIKLFQERMTIEQNGDVADQMIRTLHPLAGVDDRYLDIMEKLIESDNRDIHAACASKENSEKLASLNPQLALRLVDKLNQDGGGSHKALGLKVLSQIPRQKTSLKL